MATLKRDYKAQTRTANAVKRLGATEAKGGDPFELIEDINVRDILLVMQKDLKKNTSELVELANRLALLEKQMLSMKQSQNTTYAAILKHGHQVQKIQTTQQIPGGQQGGNLDSHVDARLKGLTRELRIRATDGTELGRAHMVKLLGDETGKKMLDGVTWHLQPKIKAVQVLARDERHRQSILRQIKRNARKHALAVKVTCWLSPQQRANKNTIYTMVYKTNKQVITQDWGDRVLLVKEPQTDRDSVLRWVANTSQPQVDLVTQLEKLWREWGLSTNRPAPPPAAPTTSKAPTPPRVPPTKPIFTVAPTPVRQRKVPGGGREPDHSKWQAVDKEATKKPRAQVRTAPPAEPLNRLQGGPKRTQPRPNGKENVGAAKASPNTPLPPPPAQSFQDMLEKAKKQTATVPATRPVTRRTTFAAMVAEAKASTKSKDDSAMEVEEPAAGPSTSPAHPLPLPADPLPPADDAGPLELPEFPVVSDEEEGPFDLPDLPEGSEGDE